LVGQVIARFRVVARDKIGLLFEKVLRRERERERQRETEREVKQSESESKAIELSAADAKRTDTGVRLWTAAEVG
jgi:hypothetical protein